MKNRFRFLINRFFIFAFLVFFLSFGLANAKPESPPEMLEWLKRGELGEYEPSQENWDEIVRKATEEGEDDNGRAYPLAWHLANTLRYLRQCARAQSSRL